MSLEVFEVPTVRNFGRGHLIIFMFAFALLPSELGLSIDFNSRTEPCWSRLDRFCLSLYPLVRVSEEDIDSEAPPSECSSLACMRDVP